MSEYKQITGELRDWFEHAYSYDVGETPWFGWKSTIEQMLDAIDSIHAALEAENELLREQDHDGWVELPKDADGVPWHIGDRTESGQTVEAMGLNKHGWHFVGTVNEIDPAIHRHYHAPTVEDVLREFAEKITDSQIPGVHPTYDEAIAEYTQRLTLAGDAE